MVHVKIDEARGIEQTAGSGFELASSAAHQGISPFRLETSGSTPISTAFSAAPGFYFLSGSTACTATLPSPGDHPGALFMFGNAPTGGLYFITASSRVLSTVTPFGVNGISTALSTAKQGNSITASGSLTLLSDGLRYVPLASSGGFQLNA